MRGGGGGGRTETPQQYFLKDSILRKKAMFSRLFCGVMVVLLLRR